MEVLIMSTTTKDEKTHLQNREITYEMLAKAIYHFSKRAKLHRDNIRWQKHLMRTYHFYDKFNKIDSEKSKRDDCYTKKDLLLLLLKPCEIHASVYKRPVYDDGLYLGDEPVDIYYLCYRLGGKYAFHKPIKEEDVSKYPDLEVKTIPELFVSADVNDGMNCSVWLANKIVALVNSGDFTLLMDE